MAGSVAGAVHHRETAPRAPLDGVALKRPSHRGVADLAGDDLGERSKKGVRAPCSQEPHAPMISAARARSKLR
jgi:hypothetical protein